MNATTPPPAVLQLRPVELRDRLELTLLLEQPHLARRRHLSGIQELHRLEWNKRRRTFAVVRGERLIGKVELLADEEDPDEWELSVVLGDEHRPGDGTRCGLAALFYAFEIMDAALVWFWVASNNEPAMKFAERMGFVTLNTMKLPSGKPARVYEMDREAWESTGGLRLEQHLNEVIEVADTQRAWRGENGAFSQIEPAEPARG